MLFRLFLMYHSSPQGTSTLMTAAYRNAKDIVADMMQTYYPSAPDVTIVRDAKYVTLV